MFGKPSMFAGLLIAVSTASLASSDDTSHLMQSAVGVAHRVSSEELQFALRDIKEDVSNIPGQTRQLAINALLRSVSKSDRLDAYAVEVLNNVTTLLNNILSDMLADKGVRQNELDEVFAEVELCQAGAEDNADKLPDQVTNASTYHNNCRTQEAVLFDDDAQKCLELVTFLTGLIAPDCTRHDADYDSIPAWTDFFNDGHSFFTLQKNNYEPKRDACLDAEQALADKIIECNGFQGNYETLYCEWRLDVISRCDKYTECYDAAVARHQNTTDRIRPLSEQRVKEAGVVIHVICLIEKLIAGETDRTVCESMINETANEETYGNTFPDAPAAEPCETTEVNVYPGHPDWVDFAYPASVIDRVKSPTSTPTPC